VISKVIKSESNDQSPETNQFLQHLVNSYANTDVYNQSFTRLMVQIFKDMTDDRLSVYVPALLGRISRHLQNPNQVI